MTAAKGWLPQCAFTDQALRLVLSDGILSWAQRWMCGHSVEMSGFHQGKAQRQALRTLRIQIASAEVELSGHEKRVLLEALLNASLESRVMNEGDHRILDDFLTKAIKDLLSAFDVVEPSEGGGEWVSFKLGMAGKDFATVALRTGSLVSKVKGLYRPNERDDDKPVSRLAALRSVTLVTEGILGRAELTLDDIGDLAVGDVVILDRPIDDPVQLRILTTGQIVREGHLIRTGNHVAIQL